MVYNDSNMTIYPVNASTETQLTVAMLDMLFRGRDLTLTQDLQLPNGDILAYTEIKQLFDSYTRTVRA